MSSEQDLLNSEQDVEVEPDEDALPVEELDLQTRERRDAALAHVRKLGDPVLRASAVEVDRFDDELRIEVERMGELMVDALGIGLAATQVGVLNRVLVYRVHAEDEISALVNPVIEWSSEELETAEEGCLSIPGVHVEVERPARIRARARDVAGAELLVEAEGLHARVIQHEVDHLNGILILDRISREARREAMRSLREARDGGAGEDGRNGRDGGAGEDRDGEDGRNGRDGEAGGDGRGGEDSAVRVADPDASPA